MSTDGEMDAWRRQWQGQGAGKPVADSDAVERLRRSVARETWWNKWGLVFPILVTLWSGSTIVIPALRTGSAPGVLVGVESLVFIAVIWVVALWLARGTWRPLADSTAAFIDVSIRRREAYIRGAVVAACFYVAQFAFLVLAIGLNSPIGIAGVLASTPAVIIGWIGMPVVLAALYWLGRRQRKELERLRELKRQLGD
jgi:hypothetical protein